MKNSLLLSLILFSNIIFSQNIKQLDDAFGYKNLKLNSDLKTFTNLKLINSDKKNIIYQYSPIDTNVLEVFNLNFNSIVLTFDNTSKKLIAITLIKGYRSIGNTTETEKVFTDLKYLKSKYSELLGNPVNLSANNSISTGWEGEKVLLTNSMKLIDNKLDDDYNVIISSAIEISFYINDTEKKSSGF
jgi:hypothetical protein